MMAIPVGRGPIAISAPLRGDHWLAGNGPSNTSGHRRALIPIEGHAAIAQRFAIDWVKLRDDGKTFHDDEKDNKNYLAYGNDALAVADGIVTEVKDGIPENVPGINSRAVPITLGNWLAETTSFWTSAAGVLPSSRPFAAGFAARETRR